MSQVAHEVRNGKALYEGRTLEEWVPQIVDRIVAEIEPASVLLFGSVARGDDGPDSDIDLMVVLPDLDYRMRHEVEANLYYLLGGAIPVRCSSPTCESAGDAGTSSGRCTTGRCGRGGSSMSELPDNNRDEARRWLANVEDDMPRCALRTVIPTLPPG